MNALARTRPSDQQALPLGPTVLYRRGMSNGAQQRSENETGLIRCAHDMRPELQRFLLARRCDPADVDDLLQTLLLKLATIRTGPVANPRAYIFQMSNNLLHDARRGRRRQEARDDRWARSVFGLDLDRDPNPSPEDMAIQRQEVREVEERLAAMPARTSEILRLYRIEGHTQKSIAETMEISLSAVEKHLQRAYRTLLELRGELDADVVSDHEGQVP